MKAIVTGANGFVGKAIIGELISNNIEVIAVDITKPVSTLPGVKHISLSVEDISELESILLNEKIEMFYHLAWLGSAGPLRNDEKTQLTNALWTANCLRTAKKLGCSKFIVAGTIMEFETLEAIYADDTQPSMPYIYGAGKSVAHMIAKPLANFLDIDLIWCYITNAYGVGELSPRLINTTIRKIYSNEPLEFSAGTQNYDFVYIDDVARAFRLIGLNGKKNHSYVIGSSQAKPLKEFLIELVNVVDSTKKPHFGAIPFTGVNLEINVFSTNTTEFETGFKATVPFSEGIRRTAKWLKEIEFNDSKI